MKDLKLKRQKSLIYQFGSLLNQKTINEDMRTKSLRGYLPILKDWS